MSLLFDPAFADQAERAAENSAAPLKTYGERYRGRYHLPLLPGEKGPKSGGDWVPYGVMSATNLAGAITDSRSLSIWERERTQMGLALRPDLVEQLTYLVHSARAAGADLSELHASLPGKTLVSSLADLHEQAKTAAGANTAATMGTNRHNVWEARAITGQLFGTPEINAQVLELEALLEREGLERVTGLQERVVRNVELRAAGRFDDIVRSKRTGVLYLADLKTKRKPFFSWLETWIQQSVYATAEWMLDDAKTGYVPGPKHHVSQTCAILLRMPSDGAAPYLEPVDLVAGRRWAHLARLVCDVRSEARSVHTNGVAEWRQSAQDSLTHEVAQRALTQ